MAQHICKQVPNIVRRSSGKYRADAQCTGHSNLMLTMAMDLSAKRKRPVALPITPEELAAGLREEAS